jgi:uncharacterized protein YggE
VVKEKNMNEVFKGGQGKVEGEEMSCCGGCGSGSCESGGDCCGGSAGSHSCGHGHGKKGLAILALIIAVVALLFTWGNSRDSRYGINDPRPSISVTGEGETFAQPDIATVTFGVSEDARVVGDAQTAASKKTNAILAALKQAGVADKDVKTTGYNIYPRYEYKKAGVEWGPVGSPTVVGYTVSQMFEVKIRVLTDAGKILSTLGELGATNISGLSFSVDNEEAFVAAARAKAVVDAKAKAEVLARDLGVKLVRITGFSEGGYYPQPRYSAMKLDMASASGAVAPEVPAGESTITSNVTITYEIR